MLKMVERKALRSLNSLRKVKETEIISTRCMLQLYKALVIPQLEYAAPVWQIGICRALEKKTKDGFGLVNRDPWNCMSGSIGGGGRGKATGVEKRRASSETSGKDIDKRGRFLH